METDSRVNLNRPDQVESSAVESGGSPCGGCVGRADEGVEAEGMAIAVLPGGVHYAG